MTELADFLSNRVSYNVSPRDIFEEQFPQFKAMYNFIAPFIRNISKVTVVNGCTYVLYPYSGSKIISRQIDKATLELDGIVYTANSYLQDNYILLNILDS